MRDKDKIKEGLLKSKIEIIADRNERFAMIQEELQTLQNDLNSSLGNMVKRISESKEK